GGLAAGEEGVIFVEFAREHLRLLNRGSRRRSLRRRCLGLRVGSGDETVAVRGQSNPARKAHARGRSRRSKQGASADAFSDFVIAHTSLLGFQVKGGVTASTGGKPIGLPPAVIMVFGALPLRIDGDDSASRFSRLSRAWIMCGQRWSSKDR